MANETGIEWCDYSSNPLKYRDKETGRAVWACVKHSPGCGRCYAEAFALRYGRGGPFTKESMSKVEPFLGDKELRQLLTDKKLSGKKVFVGDMTDLFGAWVPEALLDRLFAVFALRPDVIFQVLTKRADRLREYLSTPGRHNALELAADALRPGKGHPSFGGKHVLTALPLSNVWLGVSVENQDATHRIDELRETPAAIRFLSCEPLLGPLDIKRWLGHTTSYHLALSVDGALKNRDFAGLVGDAGRPLSREEAKRELEKLQAAGVKLVGSGDCEGFSPETGCPGHRNPGIDWVIVGGESGSGARPFHLEWARSIVKRCQTAGVPVFVKQCGSVPALDYYDDDPDRREWAQDREKQVIRFDHGMMSEHSYRHHGQPPPFSLRVLRMSKKGGDPSEWPEELRVREFPTTSRTAA